MKKCLFVYNPQSGKGKVIKKQDYIVKRLSEKYDVDVEVSQYMGNITKIILEKGNDVDLLVTSGGDGTLNEVVNSVMRLEHKPIIGYIPAGTVNDVARSLYIPRSIKKAVTNILEGEPFKHDVFKMNDRYGIYVCCAGLFTESSYSTDQAVKQKVGKLAYALHGIKKVFSTPAVKLDITYEGGHIKGKYAFMLFLNSRSVAGMKINKDAVLNDGMIDMILVKSKNDIVKLGAINRVALVFLGGVKNKNYKGIEHYQLDKFSVKTESDTVINLDGEKIGAGSFDFEMQKEAVSIIVPKRWKLIKTEKKI